VYVHPPNRLLLQLLQGRIRRVERQVAELLLLGLGQHPFLARGDPWLEMAERIATQPHLAHPTVAHAQDLSDLDAAIALVQQRHGSFTQIDRIGFDHGFCR
jgi:hypothetical protein